MEGKASRPNGSSPKALIMWLLNLEDQGIRIFDDSISKCRAKLVLDISKADYERPAGEVKGKKLDADLFYIDNKGLEEGDDEGKGTNESMSAAFVSAAHTMTLVDNEGGRKRKERRSSEKKKQIKFLKYNIFDNSDSAREKFSPASNDGLSSESEVENPRSDEDMEVKE
ncbi:hypothetical protein L1049_021776 [Liquidambar formosana]|uniref:Uncharacterized protein n=1 Tax=Liquidambar formosana TaxID=63359 RepID=A0AAP0RBE4_LIQFO